MAHPGQIYYCKHIKKLKPEYFINKRVLDIGSLNINGDNRFLFENCNYVGIDIGPGTSVDYVESGHLFKPHDGIKYDTVITTNCFEHNPFYKETLINVVENLLNSGGMFLLSCATTGMKEHGTTSCYPVCSPNSLISDDFKDYYKNLTEQDIRDSIDVDKYFSEYKFNTNEDFDEKEVYVGVPVSPVTEKEDLYFYGILK